MRSENVLLEVVEHVDERIAYLARCTQQTRVVPVGPNAAMTPKGTVHGLRHPDREAVYPALEVRRPIRLDYEVQMIGLNAAVEHAKACRAGGC